METSRNIPVVEVVLSGRLIVTQQITCSFVHSATRGTLGQLIAIRPVKSGQAAFIEKQKEENKLTSNKLYNHTADL
jgi:hypothetical protein